MRITKCLLVKQIAKQFLVDNALKISKFCSGSPLKYSNFSRSLQTNYRTFHTTSTSRLFWERDIKGGYGKEDPRSRIQIVRDGLKELKKEVKMWENEWKEKLECDPILVLRPGETDVVWKFNSPECLDTWITTSDSDHGEGSSACSLSLTEGRKCLFSGTLNTQLPKDGRIKKAGYCNMKSQRVRKSFKREAFYDWQTYTHLVMRVRGDGRSYLLNISITGYFDILWNDMYHFVLYTRGGPYWQVAKIPFSKFIFGSKGRIQDRQTSVPLDRVTNFGISVGDAINGPFNLEIDFIGLEYDPTHEETFAYEMYKTDRNIAAH